MQDPTAARVPTLLDLCISTIALNIPDLTTFTCGALPEEELAVRIYSEYQRVHRNRLQTGQHHPVSHLKALHQFSQCWQPKTLALHLDAYAVAGLADLQYVSERLQHLDITAQALNNLHWVQPLQQLTCLSLRGCFALQSSALHSLEQLPQLQALDLSGLQQIGDEAALPLSRLRHLKVLKIDNTSCGDVVVEALTYGNRLHAWSITNGVALSQEQQLHWPRLQITYWQLAHTAITPNRVVDMLLSSADLMYLDMRGTGVKAAALQPLQRRFALASLQGAVLTRSTAVAAASVRLGLFVCACKLGMAPSSSSGSSSSEDQRTQAWMQQGAYDLIGAAADVQHTQAADAPQQSLMQQQQQQHYPWHLAWYQ
eukprot:jgi/Chrzof1/647/Cz01g23200.t1